MSEQKMREVLEHIAVLADKYSGEYPTQVGAIAREALAAPSGEQVELTDAEIYKLCSEWGVGALGLVGFCRAVIAAHEAKRNGGAA